jgi:hypothetical protein
MATDGANPARHLMAPTARKPEARWDSASIPKPLTATFDACSDVCLHLSSLQYCLFSNQSKDNGQGFSAL